MRIRNRVPPCVQVFGELVSGFSVLQGIESAGTLMGKPQADIAIEVLQYLPRHVSCILDFVSCSEAAPLCVRGKAAPWVSVR